MTISRVNGSGWGVVDTLTSAQINAIDLNGTYALDKRAGQTDTLQSVVTMTGAGRIIGSFTTGPDADTTFAMASGIQVVLPGTLTAPRTYTLPSTGAVAGDVVVVSSHSLYDVTVKDGGSLATIGIVGPSDTHSGQYVWAEFRYTGSAWVFMLGTPAPRTGLASNGRSLMIARSMVTSLG